MVVILYVCMYGVYTHTHTYTYMYIHRIIELEGFAEIQIKASPYLIVTEYVIIEF